ncbi:hypothetical protein M3Y98_00877000 [Aphelenchoides besseyi]|nr:hypothetical protein M3Y98_00876600 [Aphelenchoides besseyi]KAI6181882.1 hypothetical protein M3Y98_00877000 [Aphelenchoides besseyi]KAI6195014.1 hypothetical protein M3Y96_01186100 [Aphelenchoides besseyi]KAI6195018.1 hypothetical protein M3Y96_01186500 [Aphelenchoides besseyi]
MSNPTNNNFIASVSTVESPDDFAKSPRVPIAGHPNRIMTPVRSPLGRPSRSTSTVNANQVQESKSSDSNRSNSLEDTKQNETVDAPSPAHKRSTPRQPDEPEAAEEKDSK